jgi:hypothetical protein
MKKYSSPVLIAYGNVETLTQAVGQTSLQDFLNFNGDQLGTSQSQSGNVQGVNVTVTNNGGSRDGSLNIPGFVKN